MYTFFLEPHLHPALGEASFNRLEKKNKWILSTRSDRRRIVRIQQVFFYDSGFG